MPDGSNIKSVQSPSHPISVTIGNTSAGAAAGAEMSLQKASATLSLGTAELGEDFVLHVVASNAANPVAVLETHPTIPNHRALMATLVPKFNLPPSRPEIVFLCDRSGSMCSGNKIPNMKTALQVFLKSLPVGVKFNICSFGSHFELLFKKGSRTYDAASLKEATDYVDKFDSNFGGTEMYKPLEDMFKKRFTDMELEVFLLTDGEIWDQGSLFAMINKYVEQSKGAIRVFTLGIGSDVSHALIEGVARAGNGFSQTVGDNEKMNNKVVRMLKASLTPHVSDYTLEVKYGNQTVPSTDDGGDDGNDDDDDFEIVEKVLDALALDVPEPKSETKKPISLFDTSADPDAEVTDASLDKSAGGKYSHVPPVAEPRLLQAPFDIPPLYPFSRISVYLLLSPETAQRTPKSVVLRGTSPQGPLVLEIPVTVLPEKAETIHQLAARKAVEDLEEGRGWLYHAKDTKDAEGKLLKDKFQGRFSDMVEREAVRLGVTYQVGGKWCSFVAVDNKKKSEKTEKKAKLGEEKEAKAGAPTGEKVKERTSSLSSAPPAYQTWGSDATSLHCEYEMLDAASGPVTESDEEDDCGGRSGFATEAGEAFMDRNPEPPSSLPVFDQRSGNSSASFKMKKATRGGSQNMRGPMVVGSLFSSAPALQPQASAAANSFPAQSAFGAARPQPPGARSSGGLFGRARAALGGFGGGLRRDRDDSYSSPPAVQPALFSAPAPVLNFASAASPPPPPSAPLAKRESGPVRKFMKSQRADLEEEGGSKLARRPPSDPLEAIVMLQAFTGSWAWDGGKLLRVLGLDATELAAKAQALASQLGAVFSSGTDLLATAVVLAYLEAKQAAKKDEWEMLADKAKDWMAAELSAKGAGISAEEYVQKVKEIL
ncbi:von Willebrand factor type A domain-containing protein [Lasiosphaeris hirsuta]|uniref:von Willebrand factor type A domain-containing protein n=1 Tax=Lasiosphaeris hirsuta TaxID=260670 RepID=A0AA40DYA5_9PEZI|nr:von Willebrand factor type A domain-containing protein [Lasiosphaeris hirsuta]